MPSEIQSYLKWKGEAVPAVLTPEIIQEKALLFQRDCISADHEGTIVECGKRGFALLEQQADFLNNKVYDGSYGEEWSLRKVLRRFVWHDRIHGRALYRMAVKTFGSDIVPDLYCCSLPDRP